MTEERKRQMLTAESKDEAVMFLVIIAKELGFELDTSRCWNPWELVDVLIKDIHLRKDSGRRIRAENKRLNKEVKSIKQIDLFVGNGKERRT